MLLHDLTIENFRSFEKYKLDKLARVNLLVGDNNCGKTSVLEAVHLFVVQGNLNCLADVLLEREYGAKLKLQHGIPHSQAINVQSLFHRFSKDAVKAMSTDVVKEATFQPSPSSLHHARKFKLSDSRQHSHVVEFSVEFNPDGVPTKLFSITTMDGHIFREEMTPIKKNGAKEKQIRRVPLPDSLAIHAQPIPRHKYQHFGGFDTKVFAAEWDKLIEGKKESLVDDFVRVLDDRIQRTVVKSNALTKGDIYFDRDDERISASELGDGIHCIMLIGATLALSEKGVALIDEIDTGLHYSRLADMWKMVISAAKNLDVQVFATTHSLDCLNGLCEAIQHDESLAELVAVHRIERSIDEAVTLDGDAFVRSMLREAEIR